MKAASVYKYHRNCLNRARSYATSQTRPPNVGVSSAEHFKKQTRVYRDQRKAAVTCRATIAGILCACISSRILDAEESQAINLATDTHSCVLARRICFHHRASGHTQLRTDECLDAALGNAGGKTVAEGVLPLGSCRRQSTFQNEERSH